MSNKIRHLLLILLFLLSGLLYSEGINPEKQTFHFDKPTLVIIKSVSHDSKHFMSGRYNSILPPDYNYSFKNLNKFTFNDSEEYVVNCLVSCPAELELSVDNNFSFPIQLIPGDTVYISINLNDPGKILESIKFQGKCASIYEYKIKRHAKLKNSFNGICAEIFRGNYPVKDMQKKIDSVMVIETDYLSGYIKNHPLPDWYIVHLKSQITYTAAGLKLIYLVERNWQNIREPEPNNYYDFFNDVKINNEEAVISDYYYFFLHQYFNMFFQKDVLEKMENSEKRKVMCQKYLLLADSLLTGETRCIYKSYVISQFIIDMGMYQFAEKIMKDKNNRISQKYIKYLEEFLQNKMTLKEGDKAPAFYLLSLDNEYKSLADFEGKVVLLNFWFPGCKPCIKEIPFEKKITEEFTENDFVLINICFNAQNNNWRAAITKLGMKGINLFANDNWQKKLFDGYKFSSFPHYTLIDKEGNIISNFPKRPSEGLSEEIRKYLFKGN